MGLDAQKMENKAWTKKYLITLITALVVFTAFEQEAYAKDLSGQQDAMQQKVQAFSVSGFSEDGKSKWQVNGESADIFTDVVNMSAIKAKSNNEDISVELTADEGTFFKNTKDVELRKNVVANTDEGTTLKADNIKWQANGERIVSDSDVYIARENMDITGKGTRALPRVKKVWLNHDIKMTIARAITTDEKEQTKTEAATTPTVITCDGPLEVDYKKNESRFIKNVVIEDQQGKIFADKITVYFDPKQKKIYKAVATGNVKIMHQQNTTYSDKAVYLADEGRVILGGKPKVIIYSTEKLFQDTKEKDGLSGDLL